MFYSHFFVISIINVIILPVGPHFEDLAMAQMNVLKTNAIYFLLAVVLFYVVAMVLDKAFFERHVILMQEPPIF